MFRQITSIAGPHFGEIRNIKPPLSGSIIVNSIIDFGKHTDKLGFDSKSKNVSFRASAHTGVGISIEFEAVFS